MPGLGSVALGAAPVFGGALFGVAAGNFKGPDLRAIIKQDLDLLDRISPDQLERRAGLQRTIDGHIDDVVAAADRSRALRAAALSYRGDWRDVLLLGCALLFTYVWWQVEHQRNDWLPMFVVLVAVCVLTAGYALRGVRRSLPALLRRRT